MKLRRTTPMNDFRLEKDLLDKINKRTGNTLRSLKDCDQNGWSILMLALANNQDKYLNLNKEQFDYLFRNSHLNQQGLNGETVLGNAIIYNKKENLNLTEEQWDYLINYSLLKKEHLEYAIKYQEKMIEQKISARFEKIRQIDSAEKDEINAIIDDIEEHGNESDLELIPVNNEINLSTKFYY